MILLSNVYGSEGKKIIKLKPLHVEFTAIHNEPELTAKDKMEESTLRAMQIVEDAEKQAKNIIDQARVHKEHHDEQIRIEKANWQDEKETLKRQAYEEGYKSGFEEGQIAGKAEYVEQVTQLNSLVEQVRKDYYKMIDYAEKDIVELSCSIAGKILDNVLSKDVNEFLPIIETAMREMKETDFLSIYIHPTRYDMVFKEKARLESIFEHNVRLFIYPDSELTETSCIIESNKGRVDASIDVQLEEIRKKLVMVFYEDKQSE